MSAPNPKERIKRDPITGIYTADTSADTSADPNPDQILKDFGNLTEKDYRVLVNALKGGVNFSMNSNEPLSTDFLEALNNVNETVFVFNNVVNEMNEYQILSMLKETHSRRNDFINESKELNIYEDLFEEGGILSSEEMPLDEIYESIINRTKPPSTKPPSTKNSTKPPSTQPPSTQPPSTKKIHNKPFRVGGSQRGGGWPISSLFSNFYRNENDDNINAGSEVINTSGLFTTGIFTNGILQTTNTVAIIALNAASFGISLGISAAIIISCKIANKILSDNREMIRIGNDNDILNIRYLNYETDSKYYNSAKSLIGAWYEKFVPVWKNMGENSLKIKGYDTGVSLSRIGFVLFGGLCSLNDIVNNLITLPFFGFSYLAKKIFSRNNAIQPEIDMTEDRSLLLNSQRVHLPSDIQRYWNRNPQEHNEYLDQQLQGDQLQQQRQQARHTANAPAVTNKKYPNKKYNTQSNNTPIDEEDYGVPYTDLEKLNLDITNLLSIFQSTNYCKMYNDEPDKSVNDQMDNDEKFVLDLKNIIEDKYDSCQLCSEPMISSNVNYMKCPHCTATYHYDKYRNNDIIPVDKRGCSGIKLHACKERAEFETDYVDENGIRHTLNNYKENDNLNNCPMCRQKLNICSVDSPTPNFIEFEEKIEQSELKKNIKTVSDIKARMTNKYKSGDELDETVVITDRDKPTGGSKIYRNYKKQKTRRHRNKKTRRRQSRRTLK